MIKTSDKMCITGVLQDQGSGSSYAWAVDDTSIMPFIQRFINMNVKITIETIEEA